MTRLVCFTIFCLTLLPLLSFSRLMAVTEGSALYTHFIYMFGHASFTHWLVNSWSVLVFHNAMRWYRCLSAYLLAVLMSFVLPCSKPVIGLSVVMSFFIGYIFHYLYRKDRMAFFLTLAVIFIGLFLPNIAGSYHIAMALFGFLGYHIERLIRSINNYIN